MPIGARGTKLLGALMVAVLVLSACQPREDKRVKFDGFYFKAKTVSVDKKVSLADFSATVWDVSQSLEAALEAGRYEGTKYCIAQYGTSQIDWTLGPDRSLAATTVVDDTLTFQGRCDP